MGLLLDMRSHIGLWNRRQPAADNRLSKDLSPMQGVSLVRVALRKRVRCWKQTDPPNHPKNTSSSRMTGQTLVKNELEILQLHFTHHARVVGRKNVTVKP